MSELGIIVKSGQEGSRIELQCPHQNGLLYAVPGEASWVCSAELLPAHAMAGFLRELVKLSDPPSPEPHAAMGPLLPRPTRHIL